MSESRARYLVIVLFTVAAIILLFAPAWSSAAAEDNVKDEEMVTGAMRVRPVGGGGSFYLPLKKTDVRLEVTAGVVNAEVRQRFTNDSSSALEAVYIFPLPSRASVTGMELRVGDRVITSEVKEKRAARRTYEKAKRAGRKTALVEQERPNIFMTSVANFLPGETVEVRLGYMEPVEYRRGVYEVTFPMVVGQRYMPVGLDRRSDGSAAVVSTVPDAHRLNPPLLHPAVDSGHRLTLTAEIYGMAIDEISSNTHAIDVRRPGRGSRSATVTLSRGETVPDRDFSMSIHLEKSSDSAASLVVSKGEDAAHAMLTVFPPTAAGSENRDQAPREVIFLVDTSGSMKGTSLSQAKAGLNLCLDMLRESDHFTIVRFGSSFSSYSPDLREATPERIASARTYVQGLTAMGGTEMQAALEHVLTFPGNPGRMRLVVFLTDGATGNEHTLMRLLDKRLGHSRIFAFAIGSAPNEYLVRKMAEIGRGQARFIRSHEDIGEVMAEFFRTLDEPVLTDVRLSWEGGMEAEGIRYYPNPPPDIYLDRPLQVVMRYRADSEGRLVVRGMLDGEEARYTFPLRNDEAVSHRAIEKLFGRAAIGEMMFRWIRGTAVQKKALQAEITEAALRYQLVSRFTSRVAVEKRVDRRPDGTLVKVPVRVPLPKGWSPGAFHPTATYDRPLILTGLVLLMTGALAMSARRRVLAGSLYER